MSGPHPSQWSRALRGAALPRPAQWELGAAVGRVLAIAQRDVWDQRDYDRLITEVARGLAVTGWTAADMLTALDQRGIAPRWLYEVGILEVLDAVAEADQEADHG